MQTIKIDLGSRSYEINVGQDLLSDPGIFSKFIIKKDIAIITNKTVGPLYKEVLKKSLNGAKKVICLELDDGEKYKDHESLNKISLAKEILKRNSFSWLNNNNSLFRNGNIKLMKKYIQYKKTNNLNKSLKFNLKRDIIYNIAQKMLNKNVNLPVRCGKIHFTKIVKELIPNIDDNILVNFSRSLGRRYARRLKEKGGKK